MRFLIAYDIEETKIRSRLSRILEQYGERVQYSVFEFDLNKNQYNNMLVELKSSGFLKNKSGSKIYFYTIGSNIDKSVKRIGIRPVIDSHIIIT